LPLLVPQRVRTIPQSFAWIDHVSGGGTLDQFAGQRVGWSAMVGGGRPAGKWRPGAGVISLERRGPQDQAADTRRPGEE
jgi:hypothetical protein